MTGLGHNTGSVRHAVAVRGDDLYQSPREAVTALLAVEQVPHRVWEPACGPGAIQRVLQERGHDVLGTDLVDYGQGRRCSGVDFLIPGLADAFADGRAIVTNPPYKNAVEFAARAVLLSPYVAMLLRLAFIAGTRRGDLLERSGLARVHVFSRRLPMMHRDGWEGPKGSPSMEFAWFVWERGHQGPCTLTRVDWKAHT